MSLDLPVLNYFKSVFLSCKIHPLATKYKSDQNPDPNPTGLAPWIRIWIRIEIKSWIRIRNTDHNIECQFYLKVFFRVGDDGANPGVCQAGCLRTS